MTSIEWSVKCTYALYTHKHYAHFIKSLHDVSLGRLSSIFFTAMLDDRYFVNNAEPKMQTSMSHHVINDNIMFP